VLGCTLGYDNITQLRARMAEASPVFAAIGVVPDMDWGEFGAAGTMESAAFGLPVDNFYMTDPISRVSETMAKCSQIVTDLRGGKTGTDG
jgi:NADH-quinone oxidoreductase subunit G